MEYLEHGMVPASEPVGQTPTARPRRKAYVRRLEVERMTREARHAALTRQVEEAHRALQGSLALLKGRIEASDAGLYPANALAADLEIHSELTRRWTEAMGELARFYRDTE